MSTRIQPDRLTWPLTPDQVEALDRMLEELYDDLEQTDQHFPTPFAVGDVLFADSPLTLAALASVSAGSYLRSAGIATAPVWSTLKLPNAATTGDILYASGTDATAMLTLGAAGKVVRSTGTLPAWSTFTIPDTFAQGDIIYGSATNTLAALAKNTTATRYLSNTGSSNNPAWAQVDLSNGVTGALDATNGGTEQTAVVTGDLLYGSATDTWSRLSAGAAGRYLRGGGAGTAPAWSAVILPNSLTQYQIVYADQSNQMGGQIALGTAGQVLTSNGAGAVASFQSAAHNLLSATHSDTTASAVTRGDIIVGIGATPAWDDLALGASGKVLRSDGTDLLYSTFTIPDTYTQGDLLYASSANVLAALAKNASATRYLSNTGASNSPAWAQVDLTNGVTGDLPFASFVQSSVASKLVGRGSAAGAGDFEEITIGSGLSMSGTTLSSTNALLDGTIHTDTTNSAVTRGDLIVGNSTPAWDDLAISTTVGTFLRSDGTDPGWSTLVLPNAVTAGSVVFASATNTYGQNNANLFWDNSNNRLGILTASPTRALSVNATDAQNVVVAFRNAAGGAGVLQNRVNGSHESPTSIINGDILGEIGFGGFHSGNDFALNTANIRAVAQQDFTSTAQGTTLDFGTTALGATARIVRVTITETDVSLASGNRLRMQSQNRIRYLNSMANVYQATAQTGLAVNAYQTFLFDAEHFDTDSLHSTVTNTGRLTAALTGKYIISGGITPVNNSLVGANAFYIAIRLNGTTYISVGVGAVDSNTNSGASTSVIYELTAGDYVELQGQIIATSGTWDTVASDYNFFSMAYIGE